MKTLKNLLSWFIANYQLSTSVLFSFNGVIVINNKNNKERMSHAWLNYWFSCTEFNFFLKKIYILTYIQHKTVSNLPVK